MPDAWSNKDERMYEHIKDTGDVPLLSTLPSRESTMALPVNPTRYIMMLSVSAGWPDESLVPRPEDIEGELRAIFGVVTTVQASQTVQNPSANVMRYYELRTDPALPPAAIIDALTVALERIGATTLAGQEVQVALASAEGAAVAQGTAKPPRI